MLKYIKHIVMLILFVISASCKSENFFKKIPNVFNETDIETGETSTTEVVIEEPKLDILLVLDNSCSMLEDWTYISYGLTKIPEELNDNNIDWKIAIISMDSSDNFFLEMDTAEIEPGWSMVSLIQTLRDNAGGLEEGFLSALTFKTINGNWFRSDTQSLIIFISDEEEQSNITPEDFNLLWGQPHVVASIVGPFELVSEQASCADEAKSYHLASQIVIDICTTEPWSLVFYLIDGGYLN